MSRTTDGRCCSSPWTDRTAKTAISPSCEHPRGCSGGTCWTSPGVAQVQVTRLGRRPRRPLRHHSAGPCRRPGQPLSGADMGKVVQSGDRPLSPGKPSPGEAPAHCGGSHAQDMALWTQQQLPWEDIRFFTSPLRWQA